VFFLGKMAVFIPTIRQIKQNLAWVHHEQGVEQFKGQREGTQPLVSVMIAFFVLNHVVALVENIYYNVGFTVSHLFRSTPKYDENGSVEGTHGCLEWGHWGKFNFKLCMFALMNLSVVCVINFSAQ
jgi:hypothetical protein